MVLCWTLGGATLSPLPDPPPPPGVRTCRLTPVLCNASKLTEDDGKVHVDTGEVQLYDPLKRKNIWGFFISMLRFKTVRITVTTTTNLWNQILLDPPQLGLFSAIFCHHSLFVKFMCEVAVLIVEQRTADTDTISLGLNQKDCHLKRKKKV